MPQNGLFGLGLNDSDFNPNWNYADVSNYSQMYHDYRQQYGSPYDSDIYKGLTADLVMMQAQRDLDEKWYQAHQSKQAQFDELRELGVNPIHANQSLLGYSGQSANTASTVGQSGRAGQLDSIVDAVGTGVNAFNTSYQTDISQDVARAEMRNLDSMTAENLQNVQFKPREFDLSHRQVASQEQVAEATAENLRADTKLIGKKYDLTGEEIRIAEAEANSRPEMLQSEINANRAKVSEVIQGCEESNQRIENLKKEKDLTDEKITTEQRMQDNLESNTESVDIQNEVADVDKNYKKQVSKIMSDAIDNGLLLGVDAKDKLEYYLWTKQYDKANNFNSALYEIEQARVSASESNSLGVNVGVGKINVGVNGTHSGESRHTTFIRKVQNRFRRHRNP